MKIKTSSNSVYEIDSNNFCVKYDAAGRALDSFKVYGIKAVNEHASLFDVSSLPDSKPEVGKRMYIFGRESWWISTPVVSIEE